MLDALVALFCRSNVSADVRVVGGWLFRQLLPHGEEEFTAFHLKWLKVHTYCIIIPIILHYDWHIVVTNFKGLKGVVITGMTLVVTR